MITGKAIQLKVRNRLLFRCDHFQLENGLTALVGRNGAGKTTFIKTLSAMLRPASGELYVCGKSATAFTKRERAKTIAVVYSGIAAFGHHRLEDIVALGRLPHQSTWAKMTPHDRQIVQKVMRQLKIDHLASRLFHSLSDGEKQLAMVGRALAQETPIVIMDEPTAFLDMVNRHQLMVALRQLTQQEGKLILMATHHLDLLASNCDSVLLIDQQKLRLLTNPSCFVPEIEKAFGICH